MKNDLKQLMLYTLGPFSSKILPFILLPIVSYFVSLTDYGKFTAFTVSLMYFQTFITLSTEQYYLRVYKTENPYTLRKTLSVLFLSNTIFITLFMMFLYYIGVIDVQRLILFLIAIYVSFFTMLQDIFSRAFRANNLGGYYSISVVATQIMNFLFTLIFVLIFRNIYSLMVGQLFGCVVSTFVTGHIAKKQVFQFEDHMTSTFNLKTFKNTLKKAVRYSLPLLPGVFLWVLQVSIGRIFLANNARLLGTYGVAFKFSSITNLFVTSFLIFWEPKLYQLFDERVTDEDYVNQVKLYRSIYSVAIESVILGLVVANPIIMMFMDDSYRGAMFVLPVMALSNYINGYNYFEGFGPQLTGDTSKTIFPLLVSVIVNFLIIISIGKNNLLIVVLATNVGLLIQVIFDAFISNRIVPKVSFLGSIVRIGIYNIVMALYYWNHNYWLNVSLSIVVFIGLNFKYIKKFYIILMPKLKLKEKVK